VIANQRLEACRRNVIVCRIPQTTIERHPAMCDPFDRGSIALRVIRVSNTRALIRDIEGGVMRACAPLRLGQLAVLGVGLAVAAPALGADTARQVTFSKDVAPILQAKCQECHQPNSIAPMSLITFEEARPWARSIKERVSGRQMPPWHIDQGVGV